MNIRQFAHDLPIKRKLLFGLVATCLAALAVACAALFWFQSVNFRNGFAAELESLGAIIARNSAATLAFDDRKSAIEVLNSLRAKPHMRSATVYDREGKIFASMADGEPPQGGLPGAERSQVFFKDGYAHLSLPIKWEDGVAGHLELRAYFASEYRHLLTLYAMILALVGLASLLVIFLMSAFLRRLITSPIEALADAARTIVEKEDYSVRAPECGKDEVGLLTHTFNRMLEHIQTRDQRLRESQERYEVAVMGSSDGLWDYDLVKQVVYLSPRWKSMLGYTDAELPTTPSTLRDVLVPDDVQRVLGAIEDYLAARTPSYEIEFRACHQQGGTRWILSRGAALWNQQGKPVRFAGSHTDITEQKRASEQIARMQRELVDTSRQAGMAEVATGVLHNVGNVLNSVNISSGIILEQIARSKTSSLAKAVQLLLEHEKGPADFLRDDPRGQRLPGYLQAIAVQLAAEQGLLAKEAQCLQQGVGHIKQIVSMQQAYAKVSGVLESIELSEVVEDALRMTASSFARDGIEVVRAFEPLPLVLVDRHKVLQILINLIRNARDALEARTEERQLTLTLRRSTDGGVRVEVKDNGQGISPENLTRIFNHGFTTKKAGHGFGLHSGSNSAKEMGGSLQVESSGPGQGASFALELPVRKIVHEPASPSPPPIELIPLINRAAA